MAVKTPDKDKNIKADPLLDSTFTKVKPATAEQIAAARRDVRLQHTLKSAEQKAAEAIGPDTRYAEKEPDLLDMEMKFAYLRMIFGQNTADITTSQPSSSQLPLALRTYMEKNGLDPKDSIDRAHAEFHAENPSDRDVVSGYESNTVPRYRTQNPGYAVSPSAGFKPPAFTMSKTEARAKLAADIVTVSGMYAAEAGMSKEDFAKVLGGVAVIESRFGVAREVKGAKHISSASGAFHYLDSTMAGKLREKMSSDPRIAARVESLGINIKDGVSKAEAWGLKDDNVLSASVLANDLVKLVKQNPHLKDDVAALTARLYQTHNMGDAGARALAQGGIQAVNKIDHRIAENNPMFFRGASSTDEVQARYTGFTAKAVGAAAPLLEEAMAASDPSYAIAKATIDKAKKGAAPTTVAQAVKDLPTPQPS